MDLTLEMMIIGEIVRGIPVLVPETPKIYFINTIRTKADKRKCNAKRMMTQIHRSVSLSVTLLIREGHQNR